MNLDFSNLNIADNNIAKTEENTMNAFERAKAKAEQAKAVASSNNDNKASATEQKEPVKYWMNIGKLVKYTDTNEDGTVEEKETFVSLEIPINVEEIKIRGTNSNSTYMQALKLAKEELLGAVLQTAYSIPEGESKLIDLDVQIRHAGNNQAVVQSAQEHPLLKALLGK